MFFFLAKVEYSKDMEAKLQNYTKTHDKKSRNRFKPPQKTVEKPKSIQTNKKSESHVKLHM